MNFNPVIDIWILIFAGGAGMALVLWTVLRMRGLLPRRDLFVLGALRLLGLLLMLVFLLQPYWVKRSPDPSAFEVAVISDTSGSMETVDTRDDRSRLEAANGVLEKLLPELRRRGAVNLHAASDGLKTWPYQGVSRGEGQTAQGEALFELLQRQGERRHELGALVLISDGQVNEGRPLMDAARAFRDRGIPVSVVGVGEHSEPGDLAVHFSDVSPEARRGDPLPITARVENHFEESKTAVVELWQGSRLVDRVTRELEGGEEQDIVFEDIPSLAGVTTYRLKLQAPPEDRLPATDLDFVAVEVKNPETFKLLYIGTELHWERRFLAMVLREDGRFELDSLVRTGEDNFLVETEAGMNQSADPFDEAWWKTEYDAYILDAKSLDWLPESVSDKMVESVSRRGSGILAFGELEASMPEEILNLLPVKSVERAQYKEKRYLRLDASPVFDAVSGGSLFQNPGVYLPEQMPIWTAVEKSGGYREMASIKGSGDLVFAVQSYGAGRSGYLGTANTWRWRMESDKGMEQHRLFWTQLCFWLSSGGKSRLSMPLQGSLQNLGDQVPLDLRVRSQDFGPERNARVDAEILTPEGRSEDLLLNPAADDPGLYSASVRPQESGEYEVRYAVTYADGEQWEESAYFAVTPSGPEYQDTRFKEGVLRDVARITGGEYRSYDDGMWTDDLPMAAELPFIEQRIYWTRNLYFFVLLCLPFLIEWYRRRLLGLK